MHWTGGRRVTQRWFDNRTDAGGSSLLTSLGSARRESFGGTSVGLGLLFRPVDRLRVAAVFKSPFDLKVNGYARGLDETPSIQGSREEGRITWPLFMSAGLSVRPKDPLTLSFEWTLAKWSKAEYLIAPAYPGGAQFRVAWPAMAWDREQPAQANTHQLRLGAEYVVRLSGTLRLRAVPLRIGAFKDRQPFKTLDQSNLDFLGFSAGFGLAWSRVSVDGAYVTVGGAYRCCQRPERPFGDGWMRVVQDRNDGFRSHRFTSLPASGSGKRPTFSDPTSIADVNLTGQRRATMTPAGGSPQARAGSADRGDL